MLSQISPEEALKICNEDPCHKHLGIVGIEISKKQAICELHIQEWLLNIESCVHGGVLTSIIDSTMAMTVYPHLEKEERIFAV